MIKKYFVGICLIMYSHIVFAHGFIHAQIDELTELIKHEPNNTKNFIRRGLLYKDDQNWQKAMNDFKVVRLINPSQSIVDLHEARMWFIAKQSELALPLVNRYLKLHPGNVSAMALCANVNEQLGNLDAAVVDFSRVVKYSKTVLPDMYLNWAKAQARVKPLNRQQIHEIIQAGLEQLGPLAVLLQFGIAFDTQHHDYQSALHWLELMPKQLSKQPHWIVERADLLSALNRDLDVKSDYQFAFDQLQKKKREGRFSKADKKLLTIINSHLR